MDEQARDFERGCFTLFLILMVAYAALATYHIMKVLKTKSTMTRARHLARFKNKAGGLVLVISGAMVMLVVFPFSS